MKMKREKKRKNRVTGEKRKHKLIHTDKHIERQTDGRTDRHKSFIDMRYYTEQYSKSNSIEQNSIKSNQIKSNQIKSNQIKSNQIKSNQIKSNQIDLI